MDYVAIAAREIKRIPPETGAQALRIRSAYRRLHELDRFDEDVPKEKKDRWYVGLVKRIWYGEAARIDAWQMDSIRRANAIAELKKYKQFKGVSDEYGEFGREIDRLEACLSFIGTHEHRRNDPQNRPHDSAQRQEGGALDLSGNAGNQCFNDAAGSILQHRGGSSLAR